MEEANRKRKRNGSESNISSIANKRLEKANDKIRKKESNLGELDILPNEIRYEIVKSIIEDNIYRWNDIFNFDNKSLKNDLDRITLVSKDFTAFREEELKNFIKKLKGERFEYLKKNIKGEYKGLSKAKLNERLRHLLNTLLYSTSCAEILKESLQICVRLIIAGVNINVVNKYDGKTTLTVAAANGHREVVKLLIEMRANIHITDRFGDTALMWAAGNGHTEIVELLKSKGAK